MALRFLAAAAVLVSAAVHLFLWFDGMRTSAVVGPAFLLNAVGGAGIALLLLAWRHWIASFLTVGFGLSTLTAFVIAATVGLFGVHERWTGWTVWTAGVAELVAVAAGGLLLLRADDRPAGLGGQAQHHAAVRRPHLD